MEFKIGNRVKVINEVDGLNMKGKTGIVRDVLYNSNLYDLSIEFDHDFKEGHSIKSLITNNRGRFGDKNEFELINQLKVGDRVRAIKNVNHLNMKGKTGTIHIIDGHVLPIGVEFDHDFNEGHNLKSVIDLKNNRGRWGEEEEFELIETSKKVTVEDIIELVNDWFSYNKIFSKYDVTKQLRHNGFIANHGFVKSVFNKELVNIPINYEKYNYNINGNMAEIFCPDNRYLTEYDPNNVPEFNVSETKEDDIEEQNDVTECSIGESCSDGECDKHPIHFKKAKVTTKYKSTNRSLFDVRDRYSVKAKITRDAGFSNGQHIYIYAGKNTIAVSDVDIVSLGRKATVDCYSNIRVPKSIFETAFGTIPLSVQVSARKNLIEIVKN